MFHRTPCSESSVLSYLSTVAGLKIPDDGVFDLVFSKSSPVRKQSMCTSRGTTCNLLVRCSPLSMCTWLSQCLMSTESWCTDHVWKFSETQNKCEASVLHVWIKKSLRALWDHLERPLEPELALKTEASDGLRKMTKKHYISCLTLKISQLLTLKMTTWKERER